MSTLVVGLRQVALAFHNVNLMNLTISLNLKLLKFMRTYL